MPNLDLPKDVADKATLKLNQVSDMLSNHDVTLQAFIDDYADEIDNLGDGTESESMGEDTGNPSDTAKEGEGKPKLALNIAGLKAKNAKSGE